MPAGLVCYGMLYGLGSLAAIYGVEELSCCQIKFLVINDVIFGFKILSGFCAVLLVRLLLNLIFIFTLHLRQLFLVFLKSHNASF